MKWPFRRKPDLPEDDSLPPGIPVISRTTILPYLAAALLVGAFAMVCIVYRAYVWPAFLAMILYAGFEGVNSRVTKICGGNRTLGAGLTTIFVILVVFGPATLLVMRLVTEGVALAQILREFLSGDRMITALHSFPWVVEFFTGEAFFWLDLAGTIQNLTGEYTSFLDPDRIGSLVTNAYSIALGSMTIALGLAANLLLGVLLLFFLFRDGPLLYGFMEDALPFPREITSRFVVRMKELMSAVLRGNVFVAILQGAAVAGGLFLVGIPNYILYGSIAGIFSLVPIIGTSVVWIPAALFLAFAKQAYGPAIFLSIGAPTAYLILENVFKPILLDRKLSIHPMFLFLAILGGIAEFGPAGVIIGPVIVTLFLTMWRIYHIWGSELPGKES